MPRMKNTFSSLLLASLLISTVSQATPYLISTRDTDIGQVILAKNCLDYTVCGGNGGTLAGGDGSWRLHAGVNLNFFQLKRTLMSCNFKNIGTTVIIKNQLTNESVSLDPIFDASSYLHPVANLNFPAMSLKLKQQNMKRIASHLNSGNKSEAISEVIRLYQLDPNGYSIKLGGDMGNAGAVTDHSKGEIRVSDSAFAHPCLLTLTLRHEMEHVTQMQRVESCYSMGNPTNLSDHINRERSAYLNDIRTIPQHCGDEHVSRALQESTIDQFIKSYIIHK
jgi:hypothetical protein